MFKGESIEFNDKCLAHMTDLARVRKLYRLHIPAQVVGNKPHDTKGGVSGVRDEVALRELEISILGLMALRGAG
jgi:hypothetical protein